MIGAGAWMAAGVEPSWPAEGPVAELFARRLAALWMGPQFLGFISCTGAAIASMSFRALLVCTILARVLSQDVAFPYYRAIRRTPRFLRRARRHAVRRVSANTVRHVVQSASRIGPCQFLECRPMFA